MAQQIHSQQQFCEDMPMDRTGFGSSLQSQQSGPHAPPPPPPANALPQTIPSQLPSAVPPPPPPGPPPPKPTEEQVRLSHLQDQAKMWQEQKIYAEKQEAARKQQESQYIQTIAQTNPEVNQCLQNEAKFQEQYQSWLKQFDEWKEQNKNHPDKNQYKQYEEQWRQYEVQMDQQRQQLQEKKAAVLARYNIQMPGMNIPPANAWAEGQNQWQVHQAGQSQQMGPPPAGLPYQPGPPHMGPPLQTGPSQGVPPNVAGPPLQGGPPHQTAPPLQSGPPHQTGPPHQGGPPHQTWSPHQGNPARQPGPPHHGGSQHQTGAPHQVQPQCQPGPPRQPGLQHQARPPRPQGTNDSPQQFQARAQQPNQSRFNAPQSPNHNRSVGPNRFQQPNQPGQVPSLMSLHPQAPQTGGPRPTRPDGPRHMAPAGPQNNGPGPDGPRHGGPRQQNPRSMRPVGPGGPGAPMPQHMQGDSNSTPLGPRQPLQPGTLLASHKAQGNYRPPRPSGPGVNYEQRRQGQNTATHANQRNPNVPSQPNSGYPTPNGHILANRAPSLNNHASSSAPSSFPTSGAPVRSANPALSIAQAGLEAAKSLSAREHDIIRQAAHDLKAVRAVKDTLPAPAASLVPYGEQDPPQEDVLQHDPHYAGPPPGPRYGDPPGAPGYRGPEPRYGEPIPERRPVRLDRDGYPLPPGPDRYELPPGEYEDRVAYDEYIRRSPPPPGRRHLPPPAWDDPYLDRGRPIRDPYDPYPLRRYRDDPFDDPYHRHSPPPRGRPIRDPYDDPYEPPYEPRRPPVDPYRPRDPYREDPYRAPLDPYEDRPLSPVQYRHRDLPPAPYVEDPAPAFEPVKVVDYGHQTSSASGVNKTLPAAYREESNQPRAPLFAGFDVEGTNSPQRERREFPRSYKSEDQREVADSRYQRDRSPLRRETVSAPGKVPLDTLFDAYATTPKVTNIRDLLFKPKRDKRPEHICLIVRGPPGAGKTYCSKLIRDKESAGGNSAPRILNLDDYFMVEVERLITDEDTGRKIKKKMLEYEYEADMEESYRVDFLKSFKKTIEKGYFSFIIIDAINEKVKHFEECARFAKSHGFEVYVADIMADAQTCFKRNIHNRALKDIERIIADWEQTPMYFNQLDMRPLLQDDAIDDVEMEDKEGSGSSSGSDSDDDVLTAKKSKWDTEPSEAKLDKLDGLKKKDLGHKNMEDFLQLTDEYVMKQHSADGKKHVRWADIEEKQLQDRERKMGFVVGQTNWDRVMDDDYAEKQLNRTKYI